MEMLSRLPPRAGKTYKLEQDIQKDMLKFLEKKGILAIKHNNIGIYARAGVPDILCCSNKGIFIGIEVKRPGEIPKPHQQAFIDTINSLGGISFYATSVKDIEDNLKKYNVL